MDTIVRNVLDDLVTLSWHNLRHPLRDVRREALKPQFHWNNVLNGHPQQALRVLFAEDVEELAVDLMPHENLEIVLAILGIIGILSAAEASSASSTDADGYLSPRPQPAAHSVG